jgi:hypothetical protein
LSSAVFLKYIVWMGVYQGRFVKGRAVSVEGSLWKGQPVMYTYFFDVRARENHVGLN